MSGRCVPPRYGSLRIHTSPARGSRSITAATDSGIAPRWTGMCSAWATMRPSASNSAAEQSRRSLMFDEYAPRISTAPISSAMPASALASTDSVTGSRRRSPMGMLQHQGPDVVHRPAPGRAHRACGLGELDDRRALDARAASHRRPVVHRRLHPLAVEVDVAGLLGRVAGRLVLGELGLVDRDGGDHARADDLHRLVVHAVAVALVVCGSEALGELARLAGVHRELEAL